MNIHIKDLILIVLKDALHLSRNAKNGLKLLIHSSHAEYNLRIKTYIGFLLGQSLLSWDFKNLQAHCLRFSTCGDSEIMFFPEEDHH